MNPLVTGQRKISFLFGACFFLILALSIAVSFAVIHRLAGLQWQARALRDHALSVSTAGQAMLVDVSHMHNLMLRAILARGTDSQMQVDALTRALDSGVRQNLASVSAESATLQRSADEITHELDAWHATHARIVQLMRGNHRPQALALGMGAGVETYSRIESSLGALAHQARSHAAAAAEEAAGNAEEAIREAWWMLGALTVFNALCGIAALRRIKLIMRDEARLVARLYENEQRLKMALSGGSQGTWDLDVTTGKLSFDAEWGHLLGYREKRERPANIDEWSAKIFGEDRERVLKALHDHIDGRTPEYRAEYRIRNQANELRWVAGHGRAMHRDDQGKATRVLGITQDITQRKLSEQKIWNLAHTDILTGLPNRVLLYDRLTQMASYARRHGKLFALFFLDLDGFKQVNDRLGHDVGDKLLQEAARRLVNTIRSEDTLARVGGDEFIFILCDIVKRDNAAVVADKILELLRQEFVIDGHPCRIGGSIGISIFPDDSDDIDALVSRADDAMYQAKAKGKNNFQFFQSTAPSAAT